MARQKRLIAVGTVEAGVDGNMAMSVMTVHRVDDAGSNEAR